MVNEIRISSKKRIIDYSLVFHKKRAILIQHFHLSLTSSGAESGPLFLKMELIISIFLASYI